MDTNTPKAQKMKPIDSASAAIPLQPNTPPTFEALVKAAWTLPKDLPQLVELVYAEGPSRKALVIVTSLGHVRYIPEPLVGQMYSSWQQVCGNEVNPIGKVLVWPSRDLKHMAKLTGQVMSRIDLTPSMVRVRVSS